MTSAAKESPITTPTHRTTAADATGLLQIASTNDSADPLAWRQWHHWNLASQLFKVRLSKGKSVLTVHILTNGNMNLAYFDFKLAPR